MSEIFHTYVHLYETTLLGKVSLAPHEGQSHCWRSQVTYTVCVCQQSFWCFPNFLKTPGLTSRSRSLLDVTSHIHCVCVCPQSFWCFPNFLKTPGHHIKIKVTAGDQRSCMLCICRWRCFVVFLKSCKALVQFLKYFTHNDA